MGKIINSSDVSLEFKPWTDKKCRITRLQVIEQIGGKIPNGEIDMILGDEDEVYYDMVRDDEFTLEDLDLEVVDNVEKFKEISE